jgi:hypothetical protein
MIYSVIMNDNGNFSQEYSPGKKTVISVGIDEYGDAQEIDMLGNCSNGAQGIFDTFGSVRQLDFDEAGSLLITSKTGNIPGRSEILKHLRSLQHVCGEDDIPVFFFSGYCNIIASTDGKERLFIVPQDAYDASDPDCLIGLEKITGLLGKSRSKNKLIILDACLCRKSETGDKPSGMSPQVLPSVSDMPGLTVLYSISNDRQSYEKSPNPKLNLFTHFLIRSLNGDPDSLDGAFLTAKGIHDYLSKHVFEKAGQYNISHKPCIGMASDENFTIADFSRPLIDGSGLSPNIRPVKSIEFVETSGIKVKDVLTGLTNWSKYSDSYLEERMNRNLPKYYEDRFGKISAGLLSMTGTVSSVTVDGNNLNFPDGLFTVTYEAGDKKSGILKESLVLKSTWMENEREMMELIRLTGLKPSTIIIHMNGRISPKSLTAGLTANNWSIESILDHKIECRREIQEVTIEEDRITFNGFMIETVFGDGSDDEKRKLALSVLKLL